MEVMARITANGQIELVDETSNRLSGIDPMTAEDAAYLARGLLASAATLFGPNPPEAGKIIGDAHLPVINAKVGISVMGELVVILSVPSNIELVFQLSRKDAAILSEELITESKKTVPPVLGGGTVH